MYAPIAANAAITKGVDPAVFTALIGSESSFNPNAYNKTSVNGENATGIAQFLPSTAKGLGIDPTDPAQALPAAAGYLADLVKKFGNYPQAIAAYKGFSDTQLGAYSTQVQNVMQSAGYAPGSVMNTVGNMLAETSKADAAAITQAQGSFNPDSGIDGAMSQGLDSNGNPANAGNPNTGAENDFTKPIYRWSMQDLKDFFTSTAVKIVLFVVGLLLIVFAIYAIVVRSKAVPAQIQQLAKG